MTDDEAKKTTTDGDDAAPEAKVDAPAEATPATKEPSKDEESASVDAAEEASGESEPPPPIKSGFAKKAGPRKKKPSTSPAEEPSEGPKPLPTRVAYALAVLTGFLYFLGFPGIDLWPLSLVALVPLYLALRGQTPRRAAGLGWAAGFTMTMTGFYWLMEMLRVFSGFPTALCVVFMSILCAYQGGRIALAGWLHGRAAKKGWPAPLVFAAAFAASELLYPLLFPWFFGASVHNMPALLQSADLGGPIFVGLVLIAGNLAVAEVVQALWLDKRAVDRRLVAIGAGVVVVAALYGVVRLSMVKSAMAAAKAVKVGVVQPNEKLFGRGNAVAALLKRTKQSKDEGAELVVWSEGAVPFSFPDPGYEAPLEKQITRGLGVPTIVGGLLRHDEPGRHVYHNTAFMAVEGGKVTGRYDKEFLLAFGEYIPFGDTFPILYKWSPNSSQFSPGTSTEPLIWGQHRISALICYEDILPSFVNKVVNAADPDLLVNLTNDTWFGNSTEPWIHLALAKLRAVEHRRYLIRSTNSGVSAIVDATGGVVAHGKVFEEDSFVAEARFMRSKTVYEVLGDIPWYLASLAVIAMGFVERKRLRSKA